MHQALTRIATDGTAGLSQIATQRASLTIELLGERELVLVTK